MTTLDVGTGKLGYHSVGTGPDLVFVHGWPLHGATFRAIVPHLAPHFRCHVFDLPGTGQSEWTESTPISVQGHATAIAAAIQRLGIRETGFVAHDSGGAIARLVAAELGDRCTGLVLGNTEITGYHPKGLERFVKLMRIPGGWRVLPMMLRSRRLRRSNLGFGTCFHDPRFVDGEFSTLFVDPILASTRAARGQLALVSQTDWTVIDRMAETHARITAPVALIWGVDDPWFPLRRARAMMRELPAGAEMIEMPDAKLFVHEERPDEWAQHALRFLQRTARRAGSPGSTRVG